MNTLILNNSRLISDIVNINSCINEINQYILKSHNKREYDDYISLFSIIETHYEYASKISVIDCILPLVLIDIIIEYVHTIHDIKYTIKYTKLHFYSMYVVIFNNKDLNIDFEITLHCLSQNSLTSISLIKINDSKYNSVYKDSCRHTCFINYYKIKTFMANALEYCKNNKSSIMKEYRTKQVKIISHKCHYSFFNRVQYNNKCEKIVIDNQSLGFLVKIIDELYNLG